MTTNLKWDDRETNIRSDAETPSFKASKTNLFSLDRYWVLDGAVGGSGEQTCSVARAAYLLV